MAATTDPEDVTRSEEAPPLAGEAPAELAPTGASARDRLDQAVNIFLGSVDAPNSVFGAAGSESGTTRKEAGDLDEDRVFAALRYFRAPPGYGAAVEALVADHVVV